MVRCQTLPRCWASRADAGVGGGSMSSLSPTRHTAMTTARLCDALAALQRCAGFEDLLVEAVRLLRDAGASAHLAACMRDPVTGLWQLRALVEADGRALTVEQPPAAPDAPGPEPALPELLTNPIGIDV